MTQAPETSIVGTTLLPRGETLSDYIARVREEAFRALSAYAIPSDAMVDTWVICRALQRVGWKVDLAHWEGMLENKARQDRKSERVCLLVLDDGTTLSKEGVIGLDSIRDQVEADLRRGIQASLDKSSPQGCVWHEELLSASFQWTHINDVDAIKRMTTQKDKFNLNPSAHDCIESIASGFLAQRITDLTQKAPASAAPRRF